MLITTLKVSDLNNLAFIPILASISTLKCCTERYLLCLHHCQTSACSRNVLNVFKCGDITIHLKYCHKERFLQHHTMNRSLNYTSIAPGVMKCSLGYQSMNKTDIEILYDVSIGTSAVNCLTSVTAILANALVIAAISRSPSLQTPSNMLLCCLALTDFLTGFISQPLFVISHIARIEGNSKLYCATTLAFSVSVAILAIVSFFTLTAISVDKFLSLHLHLRYRALVTKRRVAVTTLCCWIICLVEVSLTIPYRLYTLHFGFLVFFLAVGILLSLAAYYRIFAVIRMHEASIKAERQLVKRLHGTNDMDVAKHKKASRTMAIVSAVFLLCYVPYIIVLIANMIIIPKRTNLVDLKIAGNVSLSLVLGNASLSPFLYCYRIEGIRRGITEVMRSLTACRESTRPLAPLWTRDSSTSQNETVMGS